VPVRTTLEEYFRGELRSRKKRRKRLHERGRIDTLPSTHSRSRFSRSACSTDLIAFTLLLSGSAILVGQISMDVERLVVVNMGLTAVSLFGIVIAIFIAFSWSRKEIEKAQRSTRAVAASAALGVQSSGSSSGLAGNAGGEYLLSWHRSICGVLYVPTKFQKPEDDWFRGRAVFHHPAVPGHLPLSHCSFSVVFRRPPYCRGVCFSLF